MKSSSPSTLKTFKWVTQFRTSRSLSSTWWDERGPELVEHFRRGYEELEPWPEQHPKQLQRLMLARNLALMNFLMNAPDAETRAQTPDYLNRMDARLASDAW